MAIQCIFTIFAMILTLKGNIFGTTYVLCQENITLTPYPNEGNKNKTQI